MQFQFESMAAFWLMDGHGPYVWGAYFITALVLIYLLVSPLVQRNVFFRQQQKLQRLAQQKNRT